MSNKTILTIQNLEVNYKTRKGEVNAVRDTSFNLFRGENLGLVGESGCGKSTLAFAIMNYLGPNGHIAKGSIKFQGEELVGKSDKELRQIRGCDMAMVYQESMSSLNPCMRVFDQLAETIIAHQGITKRESREQCEKILHRVHMGDIKRILESYPYQLSGGQQQRILIAMSLLNNPSLLIMDEPTTSLDVTVEAAVLDLIIELQNKQNTAILYISHNLGVVAQVADKIAVMYTGEVVELSSKNSIFEEPLHPYTKGLMNCIPDPDAPHGTKVLLPIKGAVPSLANIPEGCIFSPRCDFAQEICKNKHPDFREIAPNHFIRCHLAERFQLLNNKDSSICKKQVPMSFLEEEKKEKILVAKDICVYYQAGKRKLRNVLLRKERDQVKAVDNINIEVLKNKTVGIVGESGCGKSTLARALVGLETLAGGNIEFLGVDISSPINKRDRSTIKELQMVFQNPHGALNPSYSVGNQISTSLRRFGIVPKKDVYGEVIRILRSVKLDETYYRRFPRQLSGGEKQRVGIAKALAPNPSIIICDEPVSSLDVSVQASIITMLLEVQKNNLAGIIIISHNLGIVRYLSDYVIVMYLGKVMEEGSSELMYNPPFHPYTASLLAAVPKLIIEPHKKGLRLSGPVPSAINPPAGCRFHTRCPLKIGKICEVKSPPAKTFGDGHVIYCHLPEKDLPRSRIETSTGQ